MITPICLAGKEPPVLILDDVLVNSDWWRDAESEMAKLEAAVEAPIHPN